MDPDWLRWVKRLQAIAQDGLTYARDGYDLGRYEQLRELAAEILAAHSTGSIERPRELLELETGPATPKVDVRAAVFRGGRILLVKESDDGGWAVPGGWADVGESAAEGAVREVYEEAGYRVRAVRLISAYDRDRHNLPHPLPRLQARLSVRDTGRARLPRRRGGRRRLLRRARASRALALACHPRPGEALLRAPPQAQPAVGFRLNFRRAPRVAPGAECHPTPPPLYDDPVLGPEHLDA
jgi:ADP-ribose pyrophosphatase YjhB (NUDIX family)